MQVTLPDGSELELEDGATGADAARAIGEGLARAALAVRQDGQVRDLWQRADIGRRDGWYDRTLEPHACALVKVRFA